jgi:superkiller protein 3
MNSQEAAPEKIKGTKKAEDDSGFPPIPLFDAPTHTKPTKGEALTRADGLADGFILLGLNGAGVEEGWHWVLNGKDEPTIRESSSHVAVNTNGRLRLGPFTQIR